ncbi:MAG: class II fructose-1,6-bisphosphate aldolase [archaeon]|jgi:fructose-bisphosphate aldolase class II|nr:class II fructose-1,6-bisphosphate aldolase [archaeon]
MPIATLKQVLGEAKKKKYAVGGFNVNNMEQIQAIMLAAQKTKSPVILQASKGALAYTNLVYIKHLVLAALEENSNLPIVMHLDHGDSLETVKKAIGLGFSSVMIDASNKSFRKNVELTKKVVKYAHGFGVSVEAELGTLGGIEEHVKGAVKLTDPKQAIDFVDKTGIDALAVAIGTSHGAYKFKKTPKLALELVKEIAKNVNIPLVMHGSSSIPLNLRQQINRYGGKMPNAKGVPISSIQKAIKYGISKVNVDSDSRMAITATIRKVFKKHPEKFDPREYLGPAREEMTKLIASKMRAFKTAGHAKDYRVVSLKETKKRYR